ncbi:MAG TPA: VWA domain-containing protein [Bryobacteraceae bacterium]
MCRPACLSIPKACALLVLLASAAAAQSSRKPPPTFSVKSTLVRLLVSVRDHNGGIITNLNRDDFSVFDNGVPQTLSVFERNTSLPLSVAILIDTSGSTDIDLRYEVNSVSKFLPALLDAGNPGDAFALFSFDGSIDMALDFSRSRRNAERVLRSLKGGGGTSLYDAIYLASGTLANREGRHVMVVVTDGGDTTSYKSYGDALAAAQRADVVMYPIIVIPIESEAGRNLGGEHALDTLAQSTGGRIFYPSGYAGLDAAFSQILHALRTQYLLGYYPRHVQHAPRMFHTVKVKTKDASLRVIARTGYYEP